MADARNRDRLRAAALRLVENVERWLRTGVPAGPDESRAMYEQLCAALGRKPIDVDALTEVE